jgi:hypothetical protein
MINIWLRARAAPDLALIGFVPRAIAPDRQRAELPEVASRVADHRRGEWARMSRL